MCCVCVCRVIQKHGGIWNHLSMVRHRYWGGIVHPLNPPYLMCMFRWLKMKKFCVEISYHMTHDMDSYSCLSACVKHTAALLAKSIATVSTLDLTCCVCNIKKKKRSPKQYPQREIARDSVKPPIGVSRSVSTTLTCCHTMPSTITHLKRSHTREKAQKKIIIIWNIMYVLFYLPFTDTHRILPSVHNKMTSNEHRMNCNIKKRK